jgi:hypothetical protein
MLSENCSCVHCVKNMVLKIFVKQYQLQKRALFLSSHHICKGKRFHYSKFTVYNFQKVYVYQSEVEQLY